jgi:hypothetical protein
MDYSFSSDDSHEYQSLGFGQDHRNPLYFDSDREYSPCSPIVSNKNLVLEEEPQIAENVV